MKYLRDYVLGVVNSQDKFMEIETIRYTYFHSIFFLHNMIAASILRT